MTTRAGHDDQPWARCYAAALESGLAESADLLHAAVSADTLPCGPSGHALVPAAFAGLASRAWVDGRIVTRSAGTETIVRNYPVEGFRFVALRHIGKAPADAEPAPQAAWLLGLAWLRLGLSQRLLRSCITYLGQRTAFDDVLLSQQMIKDSLAEAVVSHLEIRSAISGACQPDLAAALNDAHHQISAADRGLTLLLGASGFITESPGHVAYISELLADPHVGRRT